MVRFSVDSSIARCTSRLLVRLLKFIVSATWDAGSSCPRNAATVTDLDVPGSPTSRQGLPTATAACSSHVILRKARRDRQSSGACASACVHSLAWKRSLATTAQPLVRTRLTVSAVGTRMRLNWPPVGGT